MIPRENPALFGHEAAEAAFAAAIDAGRTHHAWLLAGPPGIGKATLAYRLARRLLGGPAAISDPKNPVFRRIAAASHADLLTIERAYDEKRKRLKTGIAVEQTRAIGAFMHLTAAEGGWRVVVIDGADDMNPNAANAVLKVLEEPSRRAILLLTADAPGRLLPTIRSRCRRLLLHPLPDPAMRQALAPLVPQAEVEPLLAIAEGSPGRALTMAEEGAVTLATLVQGVLAAPALTVPRMHEVAETATKSDSGFALFMELLQSGLGAAVRDAAAAGQHRGRPLAEWGEVWHALSRLHDETERFNLDKRSAIVAGLELLGGR